MNFVSWLSGITGSKEHIIHLPFYLPEFSSLCSLLWCKIIPGSFKKNQTNTGMPYEFVVIPIWYWIFYDRFLWFSRNTACCTCCQCCDANLFLNFQHMWHKQVAAILAISYHSSYTANKLFHISFLHMFLKGYFSRWASFHSSILISNNMLLGPFLLSGPSNW